MNGLLYHGFEFGERRSTYFSNFILAGRLKLQRNKLRLGDTEYFGIAQFPHRKASGHQHQIQHRRFTGVHLQNAQASVRIADFQILLLYRFQFLGGWKVRNNKNSIEKRKPKNEHFLSSERRSAKQ